MTHRTLRYGAIAATLALALTACAGGPKQTPVVVAREAVAASAAVYSASFIGFRTYAALPRCNPAPKPCKVPQTVVDLGTKLVLARDAIDRARDVANLIPDGTAPTAAEQAVIDAAAKAVGDATAAVKEAGQ